MTIFCVHALYIKFIENNVQHIMQMKECLTKDNGNSYTIYTLKSVKIRLSISD